MSEIREGDLVMVVRPGRCGCTNSIGKVFRFTNITSYSPSVCAHCGKRHTAETAVLTPFGGWCSIYRLKRIPPLDQLDLIDQVKELTT